MRFKPSRSAIALGLAGLLGVVLGYMGEASARDRSNAGGFGGGISISSSSRSAERGVERLSSWEKRSSNRRGRSEDYGSSGLESRYNSSMQFDDGRSYWDLDAPDTVRTERGSFVSVYGRGDGLARNRAFDGLEILENDGNGGGGIAYFGEPGSYDIGAERAVFPSDPKIIDIETERLDRRPIGPSGIETIYTGGAKIIRISPDYGRKDRRQAAASSPGELGSSVSVSSRNAPWTEGWLRDCTNAHASFDPDYGTYERANGQTAFCTGE